MVAVGDSGTWIIDSDTGGLYGHVVAGQPGLRIAYMVSAIDIKIDIECQLGAAAELPKRARELRGSISAHQGSEFP